MELELHQLDMRYEQLRVRRPEREKRLLASLAERGQQVPIIVIPLAGEPNRFLVIDGHKRIRALRRLRHDTVRAVIWDMDEAEALLLDRSLRTAEHETALEQGWLLDELHRGFGLSFEDLARRFDRSVSWVSRRLALVRELPGAVQKHVREGKIGAQAAMKYLVPMARVKRYDCERLAEKIAYHQFTTQEVGVLYTAWRSQPRLRESLIEDPKLFLRARREIEQDDPVSVRAGEELLRNLDMVGAITRRVERQWHEAVRTMDGGERENAWLCVQQAIADLTRLSTQMEKENAYVESEPADSDSRTAPQGSPSSPDCTRDADLARSSQESGPFGIDDSSAHSPTREGGTVSAGDPRPVQLLPRQFGPGP